jgi:hypothetical protein
VAEGSEHEMLERARRGLAPTLADSARIRQRVTAALAGIPASSAPDPAPSDAPLGPGSEASPWVAKFVVAGAVVAAGGLGYLAGHDAGVREERGRAPALPASVMPSAPSSQLLPLALPAETPALSSAVAEKGRAAPLVGSARAAPSAVSSRAAFDDEVIQLRRVQRALREGNARLALALLEDLDRAVPQGRLGEERAAANTLARCALGVGPPPVLATDFAARFPNSVYGVRVRQACGEVSPNRANLPTDPASSGNSPSRGQ